MSLWESPSAPTTQKQGGLSHAILKSQPFQTHEEVRLQNLSTEAGTELLHFLGVRGRKEALEEAVAEFEGHALALMLLGIV